MVKSPKDDADIDDYDSVDEYISAALEDGWTLEGEDFEGRPCAYCGELIEFAKVMRNPEAEIPTYDIQVADPEEREDEPYVDRHYFCSDRCRKRARGSTEWHLHGQDEHVEPDRIHVDELEGMA